MATILIVDDEKPLRDFLAEALQHGGHRVLQAKHGRQALMMIASGGEHRPDLVISDVMMPIVGGVELCALLKADLATVDIPVVLMSAATAHANVVACADDYISKPFDLDMLEALISRMLAINPSPLVRLSPLSWSRPAFHG
jgi:CheY-like chemotaxis protein